VALLIFVVHQRRVRVALVAVPLVALAAAFAPQGVIDRLTTCFGETGYFVTAVKVVQEPGFLPGGGAVPPAAPGR
jgi:hypothetical protein